MRSDPTIGVTPESRVYMPIRQRYSGWETLIVHTRGEPATVLPQLRAIVAAADPTLPLFGTMTLDQSVKNGLNLSTTAALVAGFFAALALLIAAVGLYAVVASAVAERTREIGVRLALGSTPGAVLRLVMRGSMRLGAWGLTIGLLASVGAARAIGGLLYGVSPADPLTFTFVPIALALVVVMATYSRRVAPLVSIPLLHFETTEGHWPARFSPSARHCKSLIGPCHHDRERRTRARRCRRSSQAWHR